MKKFVLVLSLLFTFIGSQIFSTEETEVYIEKGKKYTYNLAITAIFRDEAPYLKEWIEFHRLVGVEHFYLSNNLSVDNYLEVLQPYIDEGVVDLIEWPFDHDNNNVWNEIQCNAYMNVINNVQGIVKWLALIDTDEFLFPVKKKSLVDFLSKYEKFGGVAVNWQMFGTSNVSKVPEDRLMTEMLTLRLPQEDEVNKHVKSIVRPECVLLCDNPHYVIYRQGFYQVNSDKEKFCGPFSPYIQVNAIRINHYTLRDEYFLHTYKLPRLAKRGVDIQNLEESYKLFNQIDDKTIFRFLPQLKELITIDN